MIKRFGSIEAHIVEVYEQASGVERTSELILLAQGRGKTSNQISLIAILTTQELELVG